MRFKNDSVSNPMQRICRRSRIGIVGMFTAMVFLAGCSTMPNPAKQLANHVSTKTSEAAMRSKVEKDPFPAAKDAGLD